MKPGTVSLDEDVETEDGSIPRELRIGPESGAVVPAVRVERHPEKDHQGLAPGFRTVFVLRDVEGMSTERNG